MSTGVSDQVKSWQILQPIFKILRALLSKLSKAAIQVVFLHCLKLFNFFLLSCTKLNHQRMKGQGNQGNL